jgi:hypothetical protein
MAFKIQDLMMDVLPGSSPMQFADVCTGGSTCVAGGDGGDGGNVAEASTGTGQQGNPCHPASCGVSQNPGPEPPKSFYEARADLALLRHQLRQTLGEARA